MSQAANRIHKDKESDSKKRLRLWLKLLKLSRQVEGELRDNLRVEFQSTLPRFDVMAALYRFPEGLRMNELSQVLKVSNGNVTGIVDRLVNDELLVRIAVPGDRRALLVKLTVAGKKEFMQQAIQHEGWVDDLLNNLDTNDMQLMMDLVDKAFSGTTGEQTEI